MTANRKPRLPRKGSEIAVRGIEPFTAKGPPPPLLFYLLYVICRVRLLAKSNDCLGALTVANLKNKGLDGEVLSARTNRDRHCPRPTTVVGASFVVWRAFCFIEYPSNKSQMDSRRVKALPTGISAFLSSFFFIFNLFLILFLTFIPLLRRVP